MRVTICVGGEQELEYDLIEAVDPLSLPGFITIVQHINEDPERHTHYIWPSHDINNMVIETVEGEKFEHTDTPKWFKPV
mgnify:CR=1 FL=1